MTTEERFDRIEHVTAALADERRKDREENRQLWRDTQRQINENTAAIGALTLKMAENNDAIRAAIEETHAAIRAESARAKAAEDELRDRIQGLVSGMGQFLARFSTKPKE